MRDAQHNVASQKQQYFERDRADCRDKSNLQTGNTQRANDKISFNTPTAQHHPDTEKYNTCMLQLGWTKNQIKLNSIAPENIDYNDELELQVRYFFTKNPEYLESKDKEENLFIEFKKILNDPRYDNLSLQQVLAIAHERLTSQQDNFNLAR